MLLMLSTTLSSALAQACPEALPEVHNGDLDRGSRNEISGLAASRRATRLYWVHEDSGDGPRVYALDDTGHQLAAFDVTGATATDWEDLATAEDGDGVARIYVGDIGDNRERRSRVTVWRFREPTVDRRAPVGGVTARAERIDLTWPDGPRNAETLIVDGDRGEIVIVSKSSSGSSDVVVAPATPGAHTLRRVGTLHFGSGELADADEQTTGGSLAQDGSGVVVRTYGDAYYWAVAPGQSVADALVDGTPCHVELPGEEQGEAISFDRSGDAVLTMSEGQYTPVWKVPLAW